MSILGQRHFIYELVELLISRPMSDTEEYGPEGSFDETINLLRDCGVFARDQESALGNGPVTKVNSFGPSASPPALIKSDRTNKCRIDLHFGMLWSQGRNDAKSRLQ